MYNGVNYLCRYITILNVVRNGSKDVAHTRVEPGYCIECVTVFGDVQRLYWIDIWVVTPCACYGN